MTPTDRPHLRVVYLSRTTLPANPQTMRTELDRILAASRRNNAALGVTGALVFNAGVFGQILEGPGEAVEEIFERIQCDWRHADVTVLDTRPIRASCFESWSMGFVGEDPDLAALFGGIPEGPLAESGGRVADSLIARLYELALRHELLDR